MYDLMSKREAKDILVTLNKSSRSKREAKDKVVEKITSISAVEGRKIGGGGGLNI